MAILNVLAVLTLLLEAYYAVKTIKFLDNALARRGRNVQSN